VDHKEYIRKTESKTAVLMIHGILGTPRHFDCLISAFPQEWSIYNILLDGHGGTVEEFSNTSMKKWERQVDEQICELCKLYDDLIILAHSMGTLLSMSSYLKKPKKIKAMILLDVPLKMHIMPKAVLNSMKVILDIVDPDNFEETSTKNACSISTTKMVWKYLGWIPRYLELFELSDRIGRNIYKITVPCFVFQSRYDELVSLGSLSCLKRNPAIKIKMLWNSGHFAYKEQDIKILRKEIKTIYKSVFREGKL